MNKVRALWGDVVRFFRSKPWYVGALAVIAVLVFISVVGNAISNWYAFRDRAADRGAISVAMDSLGDAVDKPIVYLEQGWSPADSLWFYNVTQGSDLLPYDFFLVLEQPNGQLFRANENMNNRYRYLIRRPTTGNPDGLPIGMVKDVYKGRAYMGFTCAACHTGQINYKGHAIRIDGAPAMADMDSFITDLAAALRTTADTKHNPAGHARFVANVLQLGHYGNAGEVDADLQKYALRVTTYRIVNHSDTRYGYSRLDAFGRIYNQVLQYVITVPDIKDALNELVAENKVSVHDLKASGISKLLETKGKITVLTASDRDDIFQALSALDLKSALYIRNQIFIKPNAPVSYPFLWDIPQHDYVQWNGIAANAGLGPIGRNTGEVIGVFGTMDWSQSDHWTLSGWFSGQGLTNTRPIDYASSVDVHNLALIEDHLKGLNSPKWPGKVFGRINYTDPSKPRWQRGKIIFNRSCAACHEPINATASDRRVVAHMSALENVKTDPKMANNGAFYSGYSGILRNQYVTVGPGAVLLDKKAPIAALLTKATTGVVATPDPDKWFGERFIEWAYDLIFSLRNNNIQASIKNGDYNPDTTANPLASVLAYKGRSLNGIWATAPYLHNGSVPNLYDLLLPAGPMPGDPAGTEYRPSKFIVGSREFDPANVGFRSDGYGGFIFDTSKAGNSNTGHEYGTRVQVMNPNGTPATNPDGTIKMMPMSKGDRLDLLEYLKSL